MTAQCIASGVGHGAKVGRDYFFDAADARRVFNYYRSIMCGWRFRKAREMRPGERWSNPRP